MSGAHISFEKFQALSKAASMRPHFAHTYTVQKEQRLKATDKPRLLDLLLYIAPQSERDFLAIPEDGEFTVIDCVRKEKGFFAIPAGAMPSDLHQMVKDFFGVEPLRLENVKWLA